MEKIKCITFDKEAQDNLTQEIKDKMKADRVNAEKEQRDKGLNIPDVVVSPPNICTDTGKECKHNCSGLCKERC